MMTAFMDLAADAGKGGADDAILAFIIVNGEDAAAGRIRDLFHFVAGNGPDGMFPGLLLLKGDTVELLFQLIDFRHILYPLQRRIGMEGQLRQVGFLAAGIEDRHGDGFVEPVGSRTAPEGLVNRKEGAGRHDAGEDVRIFLIAVPGFAAAHGEAGGVNAAFIDGIAFFRASMTSTASVAVTFWWFSTETKRKP